VNVLRSNIFIFCFLFIALSLSFGQAKKDELVTKREKLMNEISVTNKLIQATEKKKGSTIQSLNLLDQKISKRKGLISNYQEEIVVIEKKIIDREQTIASLNREIKKQKDLYADFLRYAFKNHNEFTIAVFLLASTDFNQFYLRTKYFEQLHKARKERIALITSIKKQIDKELSVLVREKASLGDALLGVKRENRNLVYEKVDREKTLKKLTTEEKQLRADLEKKKQIEKEINNKIEALIREEATKSPLSKLTPADKIVSTQFEQNKGKLPWPTRQGVITEKFGEHYHPVIKGVKVQNNGIDITGMGDASVRSIFDGEVSKVFAIKGSNYTVIIRHGKYYTVYHNLKEVNIGIGDKVKTKDIIGVAGKSGSADTYLVHLEIWSGLEKLNPELWIAN